MIKQLSRRIAVVLAIVMLLTCFAYTVPVNAASKADMKKANVKWDLRNNKTIKYKQYWYSMGVKKHTVKMTNFKVVKSKTPGYKECTFTLTFNMKVKPTDKQIRKMAVRGGNFTEFGFCVVDYNTGMTLGTDNDKDVKTTWKWKYSKYKKHKAGNGAWIRYAQKNQVKVKIVYPESYKDLVIGVVGISKANFKSANDHWDGKIPFSKATALYSKKDKAFAHFMRVR